MPFDSATFLDIIGRDPHEGEWVKTLDATPQTYTVTTFNNGAWDNGPPSILLDKSAYFGLVDVPEPSTYGVDWNRNSNTAHLPASLLATPAAAGVGWLLVIRV